MQRRPPREAVAKNSLAKFDATINNKYSAQLEGFSEEDYRKLEYLNDLFEFLDDIIPEEEAEPEIPVVTKGKKRYGIWFADINQSTYGGPQAISERRHDHNGRKRGRYRCEANFDCQVRSGQTWRKIEVGGFAVLTDGVVETDLGHCVGNRRPRLSNSDEDSEEVVDYDRTPVQKKNATRTRTRTAPTRAA